MSITSLKTGLTSLSLSAGNPSDAMELIESYTVGAGGVASVTFSSIPTDRNYQHLQIRGALLGASETVCEMQINNDTGSNYNSHRLYGTGSGSAASDSWAGVSIPVAVMPTTYLGVFVLDILDYTASKNKTVRIFSGHDANGSGGVYLRSGVWLNTAAITSIKLGRISSSVNMTQFSTFSLYGCK